MSVTIYDIAKYCDVSPSVVSSVLNNKGNQRRIALETQKKVRLAAEALGYQGPSTNTPSVVNEQQQQDTRSISIFWPQRNFEMCIPSVVEGMNTVLSFPSDRISISVFPYEYDCLEHSALLSAVSTYNATVIIAGSRNDMEFLNTIRPAHPIVLLDRELPSYPSVSIDHFAAANMAVEHALKCSKDSISLVVNRSHYGMELRTQRMVDTLRENGIHIDESLFHCVNTIDAGYDLGYEMIRRNRLHRVIICGYDIVALGLITALNENGVSIGKDVDILALSNGPQRLFARYYPSLTVVDLRLEELSRMAISLAVEYGVNPGSELRKFVLQPNMIYRQSSPFVSSTDSQRQ